MAHLTMDPAELRRSAAQVDELAGQLARSLAAALVAMQVAASTNIGSETARKLIEIGAQMSTGAQKLSQEMTKQSEMLRKSADHTERTDQTTADDHRVTGVAIAAADTVPIRG